MADKEELSALNAFFGGPENGDPKDFGSMLGDADHYRVVGVDDVPTLPNPWDLPTSDISKAFAATGLTAKDLDRAMKELSSPSFAEEYMPKAPSKRDHLKEKFADAILKIGVDKVELNKLAPPNIHSHALLLELQGNSEELQEIMAILKDRYPHLRGGFRGW